MREDKGLLTYTLPLHRRTCTGRSRTTQVWMCGQLGNSGENGRHTFPLLARPAQMQRRSSWRRDELELPCLEVCVTEASYGCHSGSTKLVMHLVSYYSDMYYTVKLFYRTIHEF